MSGGYGDLDAAQDLRRILRLDDVRDLGELPVVHAAVFTTHDLNLRFFLTELLPGLLPNPDVVPGGMGPGHRTFRAAMADALPPVAVVFAPEASVSCDTPWRPPSLDLYAHRERRRQHAKVTAILFSRGEDQYLRLVAASANLTRRAFAANLEVAAFEDYPVSKSAKRWQSLAALRALLTTICSGCNLAASRAHKAVHENLPERGSSRAEQALDFVHSADPDSFKKSIRDGLGRPPPNAGEYERALIVSPFFSAQGARLHEFFRRDLNFEGFDAHPIDLVLDGRDRPSQPGRQGAEPFSTPPPWLADYRGPGSRTYRPAVIGRSRNGTPRGTAAPGRPLHAKVLAVGYARKRARTSRLAWRVLVGSANFTESGLGLNGDASNIEAGFILDHTEETPNDFLGPQPVTHALCVALEPAVEPERISPELGDILGATTSAKSILRALDEGALRIEEVEGGRFRMRIDLGSSATPPTLVCLGKDQVFDVAGNGLFELLTASLAPFYISVRYGDMVFSWPLPTGDTLVETVLLAGAGSRHRADRLLEFWLRRGGQSVEPDEEDLESDVAMMGSVTSDPAQPQPLGSWRLNRLLLGIRRRLAESVRGVPPRLPRAAGLLATIRVRELLALCAELPNADRIYFGELLRALLLGYLANEARHTPAWSDIQSADVPQSWLEEPAWGEFLGGLAADRRGISGAARKALGDAAEAFFHSVRDGELVE